jgi:hypothetical protein
MMKQGAGSKEQGVRKSGAFGSLSRVCIFAFNLSLLRAPGSVFL